MEHSLLREINKKTLDAYVAARDYGPEYYFPRFFPFKSTPFLTYETLISSAGRNIAGDVVTYDSSAPLKTRKVVSKLSGDIPPTRLKFVMSEADLNLYNILSAMASPDQKQILDLVFRDVDACVEGCLARLEWLTLQMMSAGTVSLTSSNNAGIVTETTIDFQMAASHKRKIASATGTRVWNNGTTSNYLPVTDMRVLTNAAKTDGIKLKYAIMNYSKWSEFAVANEVKQLCHPYMGYGLVSDPTKDPMVTQNAANAGLAAQGLPQIIVIDQYITVEINGAQTTADPWLAGTNADDRYVLFTPDLNLGNMMSGPIAEETNPPKQVTQTKQANVLVSKYSTVDPVNEYTKGEINAFPNFFRIDDCYRFSTEDTPEADGLDN